MDARTQDGRWTKCDHKSSPCHFVTVELKNEQASMEAPFFPLYVYGKFFRRSRSDLAEIKLRDFMHVFVNCKKDLIKINQEKVETLFSPL